MARERLLRQGLVLLFLATVSILLAPERASAQLATAGGAIGLATGGIGGALSGAAIGTAVGGVGGRVIGSADTKKQEDEHA